MLEWIEEALWAVLRVLWVDQVKEVPAIINQAVTLPSASCSLLNSPEGISGIVFLLKPMPSSELILPLDDDLVAHH